MTTANSDQPQGESFFDSRAAILSAIPHRPPFLFVDRILSWTDEEIVTQYKFKANEYFFEGHYPNSPIVPGVILCESAMQAGAIFLTRLYDDKTRKSGKIPVVGRMNDVKFRRVIRPCETIEHRVTLKEKIAGVYILSAKVTCEGKVAVTFDFSVTMADRPED